MRPAEKIFEEHLPNESVNELKQFKKDEPDLYKLIIYAINEARKEAIEEAAKRAKWKYAPPRMTNMDGVEIDKQSILSLINELK